MNEPDIDVHDLLNAQTGKISWGELARHFARGIVITVTPQQDLLAVAELLVKDQAGAIESLADRGLVRRALDDDAMRWQQSHTEFWAVVVAPWVLVQEIAPDMER